MNGIKIIKIILDPSSSISLSVFTFGELPLVVKEKVAFLLFQLSQSNIDPLKYFTNSNLLKANIQLM